jgi:arylsulfatase A-like enzyme
LSQNKEQKFFLWVHFIDQPHTPYAPPPPFNGQFGSDAVSDRPEPLRVVDNRLGKGGIPRYLVQGGITDKNYYSAQYDGEIAFADYMIGELMRQLKTMGLFDKTLVVVSSDHGEDMGEHDFYFSHGNTLYEPAIRIPLILCLGPELPKKTAVPVQVSSLDIVPTILDIIGIAQPRTMAGKSLMPLCKGKNTRMREEAFSYTGRDFTSGGVRRSQPRKYSVRTERWKLIDKIRGTELYDLKNDPEERKNVIGEHAPEFEVLRKKLLRWKKICEPSPAAVRRAVMTQDSHERLKGLGYLQ